MVNKFLEILNQLDDEEKISFYESLAFELTISVRCVWLDKKSTDQDKIEGMKWINELMHSILHKISHLHKKSNEWTDEMTLDVIQHCASQNENAAGWIGVALRCVLKRYS